MELLGIVSKLSEIERKTLSAIGPEKKGFSGVVSESKVHVDSVRRSLQWLSQKGLVVIEEKKTVLFEAVSGHVLAQRKVIGCLSEEKTIKELEINSGLSQKEVGFCLGKLKSQNIVSVVSGKVFLTDFGKTFLKGKLPEEKVLQNLSENPSASGFSFEEKKILNELVKRKIVLEKEVTDSSVFLTQEGIEAKKLLGKVVLREYNLNDPVPEIFLGKRQPYVKFLEEIRSRLVEMGFKEMKEQLVTQEFYNFDVLFQPQNHPARTWTDTYRLKNPRFGKLPPKKIVQAIKAAHESGGKTGSSGWGYNWSEEIASRLMPNAHGTSADSRQMVSGVEFPAKYFVINRCYRPDVLDATHLVEFNQLDGFVVGEGLNFPKLLGILRDFAFEIAGAKEVKFLPDYYPFTEPSTELSAKHPKLGWIEFAGAGIFRPEITENLGIKGPVLAWGMGVDRLAMFALGISDIRHIFSDDLEWLRKQPLKVGE